jgi:hypothetical protein
VTGDLDITLENIQFTRHSSQLQKKGCDSVSPLLIKSDIFDALDNLKQVVSF